MNKAEVLALTTTARLSNRSPAEVLGIEDEEIAWAFDRECAEVLNETEVLKETRMLEMIATGQVSSLMGGKRGPTKEITADNFRDQGF